MKKGKRYIRVPVKAHRAIQRFRKTHPEFKSDGAVLVAAVKDVLKAWGL